MGAATVVCCHGWLTVATLCALSIAAQPEDQPEASLDAIFKKVDLGGMLENLEAKATKVDEQTRPLRERCVLESAVLP
jgi:hypothetical protein